MLKKTLIRALWGRNVIIGDSALSPAYKVHSILWKFLCETRRALSSFQLLWKDEILRRRKEIAGRGVASTYFRCDDLLNDYADDFLLLHKSYKICHKFFEFC